MMTRRCWVRIIPVLWFNALLASPAPQPSSNGLRLLADGYDALEARHLPQAVEALTSAQSAAPELRDYASYFLAQAQYRAREFAAASAAAEDVVACEPVSPFAGKAAVLGARAWLEQNQPRKALALLVRVPDESLPLPEAALVRAMALEAADSQADAVAGFQSVYYLYPQSAEAKEASAALDRLRSLLGARYPEASAELRLERAGRLRDAGEISASRREYNSIAEDFKGTPGDLARVRLAALSYFDGDAVPALSRLEALGKQAGDVEAERLYYMVQCNRHLERDEEMAAGLDALGAAAPASRWRLKALVAASNRFLVKDDPRQRGVFTACAESFPDSLEAVLCQWRAAWWAYRHRDPGAAQLLRQHLRLYPSSDKAGTAAYYLGRLAERSGDGAAALAWYRFLAQRYPNFYYTFAARVNLRDLEARRLQPARQVEEFLASIHFPERTDKADLTPDPATMRRIERARLLDRAGLDNFAESELRYAARNDAKPWPVTIELAEMATRRGAPDRALRDIKTVLPSYLSMPRDGAPATFWRMAFPMPYRSLILRYAGRTGLDPYLVAALIRQESEFNPRALSPSNAVGLMQILPPVGRELARKIPVRGFRASQLTTPETNIRLGTYYFRRLLDSCDGRVEDTLAAYNAGRSRVTLWRGWGPFEDSSEFAETIPFTQTREYVQIILRNADLYRWLYSSEAAAPEALATVQPRSKAPARAAKASTKTSADDDERPAKAVSRSRKASSRSAATADDDAKPAKSGSKSVAGKDARAPREEAPVDTRKSKKTAGKGRQTSSKKVSVEEDGKPAKSASRKASRESREEASAETAKSKKTPAKASKKKASKKGSTAAARSAEKDDATDAEPLKESTKATGKRASTAPAAKKKHSRKHRAE